ncbi:nuclear transport factor 2 family protein, partial [Streptomyces rubiginosohelvolus]
MDTTDALDPLDRPDHLGPLDRLIAERACERLVVEFVRRLDLGEPGDVAELFTPDGLWEWAEGDRRIEGRDALRTYFAEPDAAWLEEAPRQAFTHQLSVLAPLAVPAA